jgi:hypothetical protein
LRTPVCGDFAVNGLVFAGALCIKMLCQKARLHITKLSSLDTPPRTEALVIVSIFRHQLFGEGEGPAPLLPCVSPDVCFGFGFSG